MALAMERKVVDENHHLQLQKNAEMIAKNQRIRLLEEALMLVRQQRFGRKTEMLSGLQRQLFEEDTEADIARQKRSASGDNATPGPLSTSCGCGWSSKKRRVRKAPRWVRP